MQNKEKIKNYRLPPQAALASVMILSVGFALLSSELQTRVLFDQDQGDDEQHHQEQVFLRE
jgi:hypothetical protein